MAIQVLQVEPSEIIKFSGPFTEVVSADLKLTNPSEDQVAFKVKTTAPRRYAVRPNSGVLNAGETVTVAVMRQPFEFDPAERVRHKFMIQTVKLEPGMTLENVWTKADPSTFMDTRLKVQFDDHPPSNRIQESAEHCSDSFYEQSNALDHSVCESVKSSISDEEYHKVLTENEKLSKEVVALQTEGNELRQLLAKATKAIEKQLPKGVALICHEKINIFIVLFLMLLAFGGGIILSDTMLSSLEPAD